jgi:hypothetical protein
MNNKEIKELVESWNWNLGIFEIYDEIRDWSTEGMRGVFWGQE